MRGYKPKTLPNIPPLDWGLKEWVRPPGSFTVDEIMDKHRCGLTRARGLLSRLRKAGRLVTVLHKNVCYYTVTEEA